MAFQDLVRWIVPREEHFFDFLEDQARVAHEAANVLSRLNGDIAASEAVRDEVAGLEHKADDILHGLEDALARTFVTPIDREDLQRLSRRLDDVVDLLDLTARSFVLFGVTRTTDPMKALINKLVECTKVLTEATPKLRSHQYDDIVEMGRARPGHGARRRYALPRCYRQTIPRPRNRCQGTHAGKGSA